MPSPSLSDGVISTGSFEATILETGLAYILDNFSWDPKTTLIRTKTARGKAGRQKVIEDFIDGACDAQLATPTTANPKGGMALAIDADGDGTVEPYMVVAAGRNFEAAGETKSKWTVARFANPCIYASAGKTTAELYAGISSAKDAAITAITLAAYLPPDLTLTAATWAATNLPTGLTIDATTGIISGTPTVAATKYVIITVSATRTTVVNGAVVTETQTGRREFVWTITP